MVLTSSRAVAIALLALCLGRTTVAQRAGGGRGDGPRAMLFGFALECTRCESTGPGLRGRQGGGRAGPFAVWHYTEFPRVADVAPDGAAGRAGIRVGDVLMSIDGLSLITDEGSARLSAVKAGDEVRLGLERGNKDFELTFTLGRRLGQQFGGFPRNASDYSAHVGGATVDVWASAPVIASTDSTGTTILTIGNITIRLRADAPAGFGRPASKGGTRP